MAFAGLAIATAQPALAAILLVGFLAFLRAGEMVSLSPTKVVVDQHTGRILLEETVCITDVKLATLVKHVLRHCPGSLMWEGSRTTFRTIFLEFCSFFELGPYGFTPYSIRRGGASYAFTQGASFDELLVRGRWQSNKTARLYLDTGRAALIQTRFNFAQRHLLSRYSSQLEKFCEQLR